MKEKKRNKNIKGEEDRRERYSEKWWRRLNTTRITRRGRISRK